MHATHLSENSILIERGNTGSIMNFDRKAKRTQGVKVIDSDLREGWLVIEYNPSECSMNAITDMVGAPK